MPADHATSSSRGNFVMMNVNSLWRHVMAVCKLVLFLLGVSILAMFHILVYATTKKMIVARLFHRFSCALFGIKVKFFAQVLDTDTIQFKAVETPRKALEHTVGRQTVFLSNHVSYLDIIVLGGYLKAAFVAKSEVATWPLFGVLAKLQETIFISRRGVDFKNAQTQIEDRMQAGGSLIFFPEGTSSPGRSVLPFKTSMFDVFMAYDRRNASSDIKARALWQPLTIALDQVERLKIGEQVDDHDDLRDLYAWHGDMTLLPHLWLLAHVRHIAIHVYVHAPIDMSLYKDRKELALNLHQRIKGPL